LLPAVSPKEVSPAVIHVENLWCGYNEKPILKGISFEMHAGELVGILGPNGSGKSTLVLALSGILPVVRGHIALSGRLLKDLKHKERARRMAVVAQDTDARLPFSCQEVVWMGRYPHVPKWRMETVEDAGRVQWAMELTDIRELADRPVTAVSGGERQRVMIARALAQETPILILDESTSAMDVHRKLAIFRILEELSTSRKATVLAVMHDVNLAAMFCRRIIFLRDGRIVADGPPETVLTPEIFEEVYETKVLIHTVDSIGKRQVVFLPE
jgi:iron complex transport system ATP-binding protein